LVIVAGTSLQVFPAAEFVDNARIHGARLAVINKDLEDGPVDGLYFGDWFFEGDIATILPIILKSPPNLQSKTGVEASN
jgi:NAD-dependent SIR2 family protein deacetylase